MGSELCLEQSWLPSVLVKGDGAERELGMGEAMERNRLGTWE